MCSSTGPHSALTTCHAFGRIAIEQVAESWSMAGGVVRAFLRSLWQYMVLWVPDLAVANGVHFSTVWLCSSQCCPCAVRALLSCSVRFMSNWVVPSGARELSGA